MLLGYNTNGLAHHRLADAIELLAEIGSQQVIREAYCEVIGIDFHVAIDITKNIIHVQVF